MDIFFSDPDDVPVPPEEVGIRQLQAKPFSDGRRVGVRFHITPFLKRPNVEILIHNSAGEQVADLSVIEVIENQMTFTMHLGGRGPGGGEYTVSMRLFYPGLKAMDIDDPEDDSPIQVPDGTEQTMDRAEFRFEITAGEL